jgi:branched-chain amino acid aminotransferase
MRVNYNGTLMDDLPEALAAAQRAVFYGDTLFETILVTQGRVWRLEWHWERLRAGMLAMGYDIPDHWSVLFLKKAIEPVLTSVNARVRFTVWREPGGLYLPENNRPRFMVTARAMESDRYTWVGKGLTIGLCADVRLPVDALSGFKTLNAARYVAAARYAQTRGWDDALLLNSAGHVCEATSSNLFWFEGETLCTVPLTDGCVTGTFRRLLFKLKNGNGFHIIEKSITTADLMLANEMFLTNAIQGIRWVRAFEGKVLECQRTGALYQEMVRRWDDLEDQFLILDTHDC